MSSDNFDFNSQCFDNLKDLRDYRQKLLYGKEQKDVLAHYSLNSKLSNQNTALSINEVTQRIADLRKKIFACGTFNTKNLTKHLANKLTLATGQSWLPIRFLLKPQTTNDEQVEVYAVFMEQAMLSLPNLGETLTLLENKDNTVMLNRLGIKFVDTNDTHYTNYQNIDDLENILCFSPENLVCVGTNSQYNAFFNTNKVKNMQYIHIPLAQFNREMLCERSNEYAFIDKTRETTLPQKICQNCIHDLVAERLQKIDMVTQMTKM